MKLTENNIGVLGFNYEKGISDCYSKKLEKTFSNEDEYRQITIYVWFKGDSWAFNHVTIKEEIFSKNTPRTCNEITVLNNISRLKPLVKLLLLIEKFN